MTSAFALIIVVTGAMKGRSFKNPYGINEWYALITTMT